MGALRTTLRYRGSRIRRPYISDSLMVLFSADNWLLFYRIIAIGRVVAAFSKSRKFPKSKLGRLNLALRPSRPNHLRCDSHLIHKISSPLFSAVSAGYRLGTVSTHFQTRLGMDHRSLAEWGYISLFYKLNTLPAVLLLKPRKLAVIH